MDTVHWTVVRLKCRATSFSGELSENTKLQSANLCNTITFCWLSNWPFSGHLMSCYHSERPVLNILCSKSMNLLASIRKNLEILKVSKNSIKDATDLDARSMLSR